MDKPLSILCIEDCEPDFRLAERELKRAGLDANCVRVDDQAGLLAALEEFHWDIVLSDYSLPGLYFIDILALFKKRRPDLPLILLSGTIGEVKATAMMKLGAAGFVSKDYLQDLVPEIKRALSKHA